MKALALALSLAFAAPAFAQTPPVVTCSVGFPGGSQSCNAVWETPSADAANIGQFRLTADGSGTPLTVGLPPKTTTAGVDTWTAPLPAPFLALAPGSHTLQAQSCNPTAVSCSAFSAASNAFQTLLTAPRNTTIKSIP